MLGAALAGICCGGPLHTASAPEPDWDAAAPDPVGDFDELRASMRPPDADGPESVDARLARALADGEAAAHQASAELDDASADGFGVAGDDAPETEARLRIDEAVVFAGVGATPSPDPRPVAVERQLAAQSRRTVGPGELHLWVPGLGERHEIRLYDNAGRMRTEAIRDASRALRDRQSGQARTAEPRLLAMLYLIGQHYDSEIEVVSGYRLRNVNASSGSRHGSARAADIRVEGVGTRSLTRYVESHFARVGVGRYPTSHFVHVDCRTHTYYWIDYSGPGQRQRTRSREIEVRTDPDEDPTLRSIHVTEEEFYVAPIE